MLYDYKPHVCGDCHWFVTCGERGYDNGGRLPGICTRLNEDVSRTDWCHDPHDVEEHKKAMETYDREVMGVGYDKDGM